MPDVFDEEALMDRVDGDVEFLEETVAMLDEDGPALLEQVQLAANARHADDLAKAAHALKGMLANFCAEAAETAARNLEVMGREGQLDDVDHATAALHDETKRLQQALHAFVQSKQG